jgi:hypothetical protein
LFSRRKYQNSRSSRPFARESNRARSAEEFTPSPTRPDFLDATPVFHRFFLTLLFRQR